MSATTTPPALPAVQIASAVLWPSFVLAGVATVVFFTFLDPLVLFECTGEPPLSRVGAYSVGFFAFWLLTAAASSATAYFARPTPRAGGDGPGR